jgi:hypothetical protein
MGMQATEEGVRNNILDGFWDPDGEKLIKEMDEAGIDKTVIFPQDYGLPLGEPNITIKEQNKAFAEIQ